MGTVPTPPAPARERPAADLRHPHWCSRAHCEWNRSDILGNHRSAPVPVERPTPYSSQTIAWLSHPLHDPLTTSEVYVNLRITETLPSGEVENVATYMFGITEAQQTAAVMTLLAKRGAERRYVTPEEWR